MRHFINCDRDHFSSGFAEFGRAGAGIQVFNQHFITFGPSECAFECLFESAIQDCVSTQYYDSQFITVFNTKPIFYIFELI